MTKTIAGQGNFDTTGAQTIPLTLSAGNNKGLLVGVSLYDATPADRVLTVTWNGESVPSILIEDAGGDNARGQWFYLPRPNIGSFNLVITPAGTVSNFAYIAYDITDCSPVVNAIASSQKGSASPWSTDITTIINNCFIFGLTNFGPGVVFTTGQTTDGNYYTDYVVFGSYQKTTDGLYTWGGTCTTPDVGPLALVAIAPYTKVGSMLTMFQ